MTTQVFNLPDLGEGLTEAELINWLVAEGDTIEVDQPIAEVETAKALVEVPSPYAGTVLTLHGTPGETLTVGNPLVTIGDPAAPTDGRAPEPTQQPGALDYREEEQAGITVPEEADDGASGSVLIGYGTSGGSRSGRTRRPKRAAAPSQSGSSPTSATATSTAPRVISPLVRQLAKRHDVDISQLTGSGPQAVILRSDVKAAIAGALTPVTQEYVPSPFTEDAEPVSPVQHEQ